MTIKIDYTRDALFDELGLQRLRESYMAPGETSPQERFAFVSQQFASNPEHAQRLYDYSSKHWLSYSTPILSFGRNSKGMPISCFLTYVEDTAEGLVNALSETNWLSMLGGGVGVHMGIRGSDEKSVGVMPHLKVYDSSSLAYKQGTTRRGSYAAFIDISHPDIIQFLEMRKPTGDQNMRTLNLNHGINISDKFMELIEKCMLDPNIDDTWELIQPHNGAVADKVSAKELWARILEIRMQTGEPYLIFIDTANKGLPEYQKKMGLRINGSNLCVTGDTQITIFDTLLETASLITIEHLNKIFEPTRYRIWSYNIERQCTEWKEVTASAMTNPFAEIMEIEDETTGKILRCTPDHKIYTKNRGYVMAKDLKEADELVIGIVTIP